MIELNEFYITQERFAVLFFLPALILQNYPLHITVMLQLCPLDVAERTLMLQLCTSDVAHNKTTLSEKLEKGRFLIKNRRNTVTRQ